MKNIQIFSTTIVSVLILGAFRYVAAEEQKPELKDVIKDISKDLEDHVKDDSFDKVDDTTKIQEIKEEYSEVLDETIEEVLDDAKIDYDALTNERKDILKSLIIQEELKWEKIEDYDEKANTNDRLGRQAITDWILPPASAASHCPSVPNISQFKQVQEDIDGAFLFEGGNQLYNVARETLSNCDVKYTLSFLDEDHPIPGVDQAYDQIRLAAYDRITDVEVFYVQSDEIYFDGTWSQGQDFGAWNHLMEQLQSHSPAQSMSAILGII